MTAFSPAAPVARRVSAHAHEWTKSQRYELDFWKNQWTFRDLPIPDLQLRRHRDAIWFLQSLGFPRSSNYCFRGFSGTVLEVGCGPIGFFELVHDVQVTATDSLMEAYAREVPFSTLGTRLSTTYIARGVQDITEQFRFVVCSNVLDHTADWLQFLELLTNRVEPGGELLLYTDTRGIPAPGHTQVFTPSQVVRSLRWLGFPTITRQKAFKHKHGHCDLRFFVRATH